MNSISAITICGIAVSAMFHFLVSFTYAQAPALKAPLIVGTWKLNPEKSGISNVPLRFNIRQYRLRPDGYLVGLLLTTDPQGGYHYLQFTAKSDGKDYPEYSDAILAEMIATGKQTPRTYTESIIDDYTTEWIDKADGRITQQGKKIISKDGATLTVTTNGQNRETVYDRLP
jgi:hypothetical protein